jgi:Protein of unknown function (DUF1499)
MTNDQTQDDGAQINPADLSVEGADSGVETVAEPIVKIGLPVKSGNWGGKIVLWSGIGSVLLALIGAVGSGWGLWKFSLGFQMLMASFGLAVFAVLCGFFIGWRRKKRGLGGAKTLRWLGMAAGITMMGWLLSFVYVAQTVPAIHDISTDLADPPQFTQLAVRADNLDNVPKADDPDMRGFSPQQRWELLHKQAYGDIRSVRVDMPVAEVIAKAARLANDRDWDVAVVSAEEGRIEATDTTRFFRFKDDVVVRVRATEDGRGSIVDMRSISRVGDSDLGVNAKRVRSFLADLSGTVSS